MRLKNLFELTDHSDSCAARIETALVMADRFDAHLTGIYAQRVPFMPQSMLEGSQCRMVNLGVVVSASGRPMSVVPRDFAPKGFTALAVVGWNGSLEAARAMLEALTMNSA